MLALGSLGTTSTDPALLQGATTHLARSRSSPVSTSQILHTKTDWTVKKFVLWERRHCRSQNKKACYRSSNHSLFPTRYNVLKPFSLRFKCFIGNGRSSSVSRGFYIALSWLLHPTYQRRKGLLTSPGATGALRLLRYKGHQNNHYSLLFVDLEYRIPPLPQSVRSVRE